MFLFLLCQLLACLEHALKSEIIYIRWIRKNGWFYTQLSEKSSPPSSPPPHPPTPTRFQTYLPKHFENPLSNSCGRRSVSVTYSYFTAKFQFLPPLLLYCLLPQCFSGSLCVGRASCFGSFYCTVLYAIHVSSLLCVIPALPPHFCCPKYDSLFSLLLCCACKQNLIFARASLRRTRSFLM